MPSFIQTKNTPGEVRSAYDERAREFTAYTNVEKALIASGVAGQEIGSTVTSVCYIQTISGGGWTVAGYHQICYARITRGYYTNQALGQVVDSLIAAPVGQGLFRSHIDNPKYDCILSNFDAPATLRYVNKNAIRSSQTEYGYLDYQACGRPSEVQGVGSISVREWDTDISIRQIKSLKQADYDNSRNQIWVEKDYTYFDEPIVCKPPLIPILSSCDLTRSQPVQ